jgi:hypothetical protein
MRSAAILMQGISSLTALPHRDNTRTRLHMQLQWPVGLCEYRGPAIVSGGFVPAEVVCYGAQQYEFTPARGC